MSEAVLNLRPISKIDGNMGELEPTRAAPLQATTPWQTVLEAYLAGRDSPHTRRACERHITIALEAIGVATLAELNGILLGEWRAHVTGSRLTAGSQAQALAALRSFLKWVRTFGAHALPNEVVAEALRAPRATVVKPYVTLSEPEAARLLAAATSPRDKALVALLLGAGLRAAELVGLDVADVREDAEGETVLHVRAGKGHKDRVVPIWPEVAGLVRRYLVGDQADALARGTATPVGGPGEAPRRPAPVGARGWLPDRPLVRAGRNRREEGPSALGEAHVRNPCAPRWRLAGGRRSYSDMRVSPPRLATSITWSSASCAKRCRGCRHEDKGRHSPSEDPETGEEAWTEELPSGGTCSEGGQSPSGKARAPSPTTVSGWRFRGLERRRIRAPPLAVHVWHLQPRRCLGIARHRPVALHRPAAGVPLAAKVQEQVTLPRRSVSPIRLVVGSTERRRS
jgi:hypothetical protein